MIQQFGYLFSGWNSFNKFLHKLKFKSAISLILVVCMLVMTANSTYSRTIKTKQSPVSPTPNAQVYRFNIGSIKGMVISDGTLVTPPLPNYAPTANPADVKAALQKRFLPSDKLTLYFNALYLDTGRHKVLVDTGSGRELGPTLGRLATNLRATGISPKEINTVILTHAHPDHIGGLITPEGKLTYPNAQYYISRAEWLFWTSPNVNLSNLKVNDDFKKAIASTARRHLNAIQNRIHLFQPGDEIIPGIKALEASGHTPGQVALQIRSGNSQLINAADVFFNEAFDLEHPDWQTGFDLDPAKAAETRRRLLSQITSARTQVMSYHMPFPALGYIRTIDKHYEWEPTLWQFEP